MASAKRLTLAIGLGAIAAIALPAAVLAAPPQHTRVDRPPLELPAEVCGFPVELSNPTNRVLDTTYAPHRDGSSIFRERGMAASRATNLDTGATLDRNGGSALAYDFAADGSVVVQATGLVFAWYLPGDESTLGAGLWLVNGRVVETYAADGSFISGTFSGTAIDACAAISG